MAVLRPRMQNRRYRMVALVIDVLDELTKLVEFFWRSPVPDGDNIGFWEVHHRLEQEAKRSTPAFKLQNFDGPKVYPTNTMRPK